MALDLKHCFAWHPVRVEKPMFLICVCVMFEPILPSYVPKKHCIFACVLHLLGYRICNYKCILHYTIR